MLETHRIEIYESFLAQRRALDTQFDAARSSAPLTVSRANALSELIRTAFLQYFRTKEAEIQRLLDQKRSEAPPSGPTPKHDSHVLPVVANPPSGLAPSVVANQPQRFASPVVVNASPRLGQPVVANDPNVPLPTNPPWVQPIPPPFDHVFQQPIIVQLPNGHHVQATYAPTLQARYRPALSTIGEAQDPFIALRATSSVVPGYYPPNFLLVASDPSARANDQPVQQARQNDRPPSSAGSRRASDSGASSCQRKRWSECPK